ncbi:MAG TPA: S41 family peptidase [Caulobacteraceae bacterium]|nr:S41 family peptidase [Caulobacteraceae bacterium]
MRKLLSVGMSALALSVGALAYAGSTAFAPKAETFRQLELFGDVLAIVQQQYVVETDDKKLIDAALNGMLASLDPHSSYLSLDDFSDLRETSRGAYGGLGLEVTSEDGAVKIITPMDDTPAARAGVQAGDYITAIDGESILGKPLTEAVKGMKGAPGTDVTITVARQGVDPFDLKLTREIINVKSVRSRVEGQYGVIRITNFNENTGRETAEAVAELKAKLPNMKGLVLDLRNNPGGILESSVQVADVFLDGGEVVTQRGRDPRDIERYNARPGDDLAGVPIVVLVNPGSASAAEIVAGALQDRKRATVVGLTSFGKGSVQTVIPLRGGQDGALKLTTARYYTPSGRSIQRTGIEPDLEVALTKEQAERLATARFQFSEASFSNALNADEGKKRREPHEPSEYPPDSFDTKKGDFQLTRAFEVLDVRGNLAALKPVPKTKLAEIGANLPGARPRATAPETPSSPGIPDKPQPYQPPAPATKK